MYHDCIINDCITCANITKHVHLGMTNAEKYKYCRIIDLKKNFINKFVCTIWNYTFRIVRRT